MKGERFNFSMPPAQSLDLLKLIRSGEQKANKASEPPPSGEMTTGERLALIGMIRGGLQVQIVPATQMVDIRYRNNDPKLATDVVNRLVETYKDEDLRSKFDRTMYVSTWLQKQLEALMNEKK